MSDLNLHVPKKSCEPDFVAWRKLFLAMLALETTWRVAFKGLADRALQLRAEAGSALRVTFNLVLPPNVIGLFKRNMNNYSQPR